MPDQPNIKALKDRALAEGLRTESDAQPPTPEELDAYVKEIEKSYMTKEEQELSIQAAADLAEGDRIVRDQARRIMRGQKRAFKGIYNRTHFVIWAKQALRRAQIASDKQIESEQDDG